MFFTIADKTTEHPESDCCMEGEQHLSSFSDGS